MDKDAHPDQWEHFVQRHRQQLTELLTQYGKIDLVCLDMWFDKTAWLDLRETMKIVRRIQPDIMFRCRGIGNYGDYYTPEGFVPGAAANTDMPWMVIYPLVQGDGIWSYEPDATKYKDGNWIVTNLVDTVAKGGNFMVGIGPDDTGLFHPKAIAAIQYAGAWLKTNGEAIFNTHPLPGNEWKDGDNLRFTHSDLGPIIYAFALRWPGEELVLHNLKLAAGSNRQDVRRHGNIVLATGRRQRHDHQPPVSLAVSRGPFRPASCCASKFNHDKRTNGSNMVCLPAGPDHGNRSRQSAIVDNAGRCAVAARRAGRTSGGHRAADDGRRHRLQSRGGGRPVPAAQDG